MKVKETKSRQTLVFDPGGSTARLRACPFLGAWHALLCGEVFVWAPDGTQGWSVFGRWVTWNIIFRERYKLIVYAVRIAVFRSQAGWRNSRLWKLRGRTDVRKRHGASSLMGRNSTNGDDYDLEPRGSAVSCTPLTRSQPTFQASTSVVLC